ncbi:HAMP domain-containing sensor histidine kinase [Lacticaseibacillus nasuensis]|uniref:HAMP domain-containing sensor histidine kinase n=1 Tax=Lacticaseibacillus nasuensis TaxID=944671 RepID=UPI002AFFE3B6|nr:HAMP domain-containing histidine kinase [Lacticaseibacillus nasuensis]
MRRPEAKTEHKKRRLSLGFKWTAVVGVGIFATFIVLAGILYTTTRSTLIQTEKNSVSDTLGAVEQRLSPVAKQLTIATVVPRIEGTDTTGDTSENAPAQAPSHSSIFSDSVIEKLSRSDISVTVFDPSGQVLFTSRNNLLALRKTGEASIKEETLAGRAGIVGRTPVRSLVNGKLIGYVQVTDRMTSLHRTLDQVGELIVVLSVAALLIAILLGWFMAERFLSPIKAITHTIDIVNNEPQSSARIPELKRNDELADLINEFNGMLDRIQRFIDQQGDFVQDVSHELRTPVAILEGHLQLLNRWGKDDPEVLAESLSASLQEVTRMKSLIQEMLDLTRADQVDVHFPNATCDVNETVTQAVNDFTMIHPEFQFTFDNDLHAPTYVQMYRNHLEQVMIILLDNAVKYSTTRQEIHISVSTDSDGVAIAVQDFGEGIAAADRARVFNRFYRVDKARSREKGGNGLGLAIAKQLVEGYRGTISVDSALGHGSIFRVDLPVLSPAEVARLDALNDAQGPEASLQ